VPVKTLQEVQRILGSFKDQDESRESLSIYLSENQILFAINGIEVISRLVEGRFPDYKQIIPTTAKTTTLIDCNELTKIIKTTALFSKNGIYDINLEFIPENKSLVVSSNNIQVGESFSELEVGFEGEKNAITLNYRFILECLSNISNTELEFKLIDNNVRCVIRPKGDDSYLYIIMPIKQ
jgi:DNA polymerase-3 subunit beta